MIAVEIFFNDLVNQDFIEYKDDSLVQNIFNAALEMEKQQIGYSKEDVLKAAEIGEINMLDAKHIVSLLDEAKQLNNEK